MARVALFAGVLCMIVLGVAAPASAHTELASSDPSAGATVDGPLDVLTLTFKPIELAGKGVQVLDANGDAIAAEADVAGAVVTVQPTQVLDAGRSGVRLAVRSGDAHPIRDSFAFAVRGSAVADAADDGARARPRHQAPTTVQLRATTPTTAPLLRRRSMALAVGSRRSTATARV